MCVCARLLLLAALPALAGRCAWGDVVSVTASEGSAAPPGSAGPAFAARQRTALVAAAGQSATLDCRVHRLADKAVSWVRSRDLQILTHAGAVFTADARVSAAESGAAGAAGAGGSRHSLRIERLRATDTGRYECQVNTEPKLSLFFNLTVLEEPVPEVVVEAAHLAVEGRAGGAVTLACSARYEPAPRALPLPPLDIRWTRPGEHDADHVSLSPLARRGVSLDTERWAARAISRLTLAELRAADAGRYMCAAGGRRVTLSLLVRSEEHSEMQRDEAASAAAPPRPLLTLPTLTLLTLPLLSHAVTSREV